MEHTCASVCLWAYVYACMHVAMYADSTQLLLRYVLSKLQNFLCAFLLFAMLKKMLWYVHALSDCLKIGSAVKT